MLAGAAGHTYGHSAVMQMHGAAHGKGAYGVRETWQEAIRAPGAEQMQHLKSLMLSRSYFHRIPDPSLIAGENGERYNRVMATRGPDYLYLYAYSGVPFSVRMGALPGTKVRASWYDPRTRASQEIGEMDNAGKVSFDPPGEAAPGNDWALILESNLRFRGFG